MEVWPMFDRVGGGVSFGKSARIIHQSAAEEVRGGGVSHHALVQKPLGGAAGIVHEASFRAKCS